MWPFKKKKPIIEEMPKAKDSDKLLFELKEAYKKGERVKELNVPFSIYSDLFDDGYITRVNINQDGDIIAKLETNYGLNMRLIIKE